MNILLGQHSGTFMIFFDDEGSFCLYNTDTREQAQQMFLSDHPTRSVVKIETVEENLLLRS